VIQDLKSLIFRIQNWRSHPQVSTGAGSRIIDSTFGKNSEVGRDCYIRGSRFADSVIIKDRCAIFESVFDQNTVVYSNCTLSRVKLSSFSYLNEHAEMGRVTVGKFTSLGPHLLCGFGAHPTDFVSTSPLFYSTRKQCGVTFVEADCFEEQFDTTIGNDVWIGARVYLRDGIRIGDGALIAAGAVVSADVPDYAIVGGVPAKTIRYRYPEHVIDELLQLKWWDWSEEQLRKAQPHIAQTDVHSFLEWAKTERA
jgi:chloramphenicol O-acetyltransferase type B